MRGGNSIGVSVSGRVMRRGGGAVRAGVATLQLFLQHAFFIVQKTILADVSVGNLSFWRKLVHAAHEDVAGFIEQLAGVVRRDAGSGSGQATSGGKSNRLRSK